MAGKSGNAFDLNLFKRLLRYTRPYRLTFYFVGFAAIVLSFFSVVRPYLTRLTIDNSIVPKDGDNLIYYISLMIGALVLEVVSQFSFIFLPTG